MRLITLLLLSSLGLKQALALGDPQVVYFPTADQLSAKEYSYLPSQLSQQATFDYPSFEKAEKGFILAAADHQYTAPLLLSSKEDQAIHRAARTFAEDVLKVTGHQPEIYNDTLPSHVERAVIVGSLKSHIVRELRAQDGVRAELDGKWESYDIRCLSSPLRGLKESLVLTGSDKRGTIYALYALSSQFGISPFHFFSDVPYPQHPTIAFDKSQVLSHGEPTVKYRGLFINDEHPALWGWAMEHWGKERWEPALVVEFYEKWFEMMLRLKANYFWPAMWASQFYSDGLPPNSSANTPGPNLLLAASFGLVPGTSHHEPMGRNKPEWDASHKGAWDWTENKQEMEEFWRAGAERGAEAGADIVYTMGMRGDGDEPLQGASNALVQNITNVQQGILKDVYKTDDLESKGVGQVWCMYKEVAGYYQNGLEVPDDVTALFADDNYGNIVSVLPPEREGHKAGAGIYYHLDYVGWPRNYKWIHTINLAKSNSAWDQMNIARAFNTTQIWIVNIGTLKPLEQPTEWFLDSAWDSERWPRGSWREWREQWAKREFGVGEEVGREVGDIMGRYELLASRRKAELVDSETWSIINYNEAEQVLAEWTSLTERATKVYDHLPEERRAAFFELVLMLCAAQANLNKLHIAVARSKLYAYQARTAANVFAQEAIDAFHQDANITETFHALLDRKWDHMWDQSHINYYEALEPVRDSLPPIHFVNPNQPVFPGIPLRPQDLPGQVAHMRVTVENSFGAWPGNTFLNCPQMFHCADPTLKTLDPWGEGKRWVDIGAGGPRDVEWTAEGSDEWVIVHPKLGKTKRDGSADERVWISIDWDNVPRSLEGKAVRLESRVEIKGSDYTNVTVTIPIFIPSDVPSSFSGHVEGDGYIVIEAPHFSRNSSSSGYAFEVLEGYGRTLGGMEVFPATTHNFSLGKGPKLEYDFWTHEGGVKDGENVEITVQLGPTLNFLQGRELAFGLQLDDLPPREIHPIPTKHLGESDQSKVGSVPADWMESVSQEIRNITMKVERVEGWESGQHTITIWGMTAGIVVERIWVDLGGIRDRGYSYLGPPESKRVVL
ncbi:hypothetical protein I350_00086 [Cryptococcus amylolentus CBS 6273]|uniref:Gylcosyl hydrolase 115 C-terminal domain-containing protein n=1 Tax=Cryptococcus amylolentus CBS 6273 TaxID=1296118 RepID=A0A1E3KDZ0_9TREE|nr:hypothetical protein I350_00086 [Cryptococcus amylolentus CBS 6273]